MTRNQREIFMRLWTGAVVNINDKFGRILSSEGKIDDKEGDSYLFRRPAEIIQPGGKTKKVYSVFVKFNVTEVPIRPHVEKPEDSKG
ncbi:MAG: hypothetical protein ACYC56_11645 [Candidatus Aquicultor sp.]